MITVSPSASFEANAEVGETGLVGTLAWALVDNQGDTVLGPSTADTAENEVAGNPTGNYTTTVSAAPADGGQYQILWSTDGSFDPVTLISEDVLVTGDPAAVVVVPPTSSGGPTLGPCTTWVTGDEVAACRPEATSDTSIYDDAAVQASMLLFEVTGRQFAGTCQRVVRPCRVECNAWLTGVDFGAAWDIGGTWRYAGGRICGCQAVSRVKLSGYPVKEIVEVLIDGDVVDPDTYRLDGWRWLTRLGHREDGLFVARRWPSCQNLALDDDQPGTFSIRYLYGADPPPIGVSAAAALASAIYDACGGSSDCALPSGVVEVVRQGITVKTVATAAQALRAGASGITLVDQFIAQVNPTGRRRRGAVYSPDVAPYPQQVGS